MNFALCPPPYEPTPEAPVRLSVGQIVRAHLPALIEAGAFTPSERHVLRTMAACKTGALGGRLEVCAECGVVTPRPFSCRNRHCPGCQTRAQFEWLERRMERVLDVPHFHLVFTLPSELRALARAHSRVVYDTLMQVVGETVLAFAADPKHLGALPTVTAVLHTWTRELTYHPHVHVLVSGGGLVLDSGAWKPAKQKFLFPVKALSKHMRGAMRERLLKAAARGELDLGAPGSPGEAVVRRGLYDAKWLVYAKAPFGDARSVFAYLGKYTHRVGISNRRLDAYDGERVTFATKHGAHCTLEAPVFIRRLAMHVLPKGLHKIRHLGLASSARLQRGDLARAMAVVEAQRALEGSRKARRAEAAPHDSHREQPCPHCNARRAPEVVAQWRRGDPPLWPPRCIDSS